MTLVLADTSVWVAHLRSANPVLQSRVVMDQVLCHPLVVLELACGTAPTPGERTISDLGKLRQVVVAATEEILALVERERFHDSDCGATDMALLASVLLTPNTLLWTLDRKLGALAARIGRAFPASPK